MPILRKDVRPGILAQPCEECKQPIPENHEPILTFYRGRFIILHDNGECTKFIDRGGPKEER